MFVLCVPEVTGVCAVSPLWADVPDCGAGAGVALGFCALSPKPATSRNANTRKGLFIVAAPQIPEMHKRHRGFR
jgi:hypothetical protein